ncbi:hypothetical protein BO94DRAFT_477893 [Aspergillus sclerotioniger CBS 115572]|uniref:Riboflavin kinase n=1 Tax=Aspergillus sclerotioniger CBS 115572 TaxID=1450535 RepID=A0A317V6U6_9EURO|nr:hypothetical protein BO94DRAFT_477893 [Aspergillus sclerotioniger CBS 115572]PWY69189.1 hypothetical protein BO94DRAFT_477893 [Aspergillus sclerotioniger CBS 115572]
MRPDTPRAPVTGPDSGPSSPYPIRLSGPVIKGFGRGSKELGIPTANIPADELAKYPNLPVGVYYGVVALDPSRFASQEPILPAVLSIGYNPFYKNETKSIEIHLMPPLSAPSPTATVDGPVTFHKLPDFYGTPLNLLLLGYIRPEFDYVSLEALVEDIRVDCEVARRSLQRPAYACYLAGKEDEACPEDVRGQIRWLTRFESMERLRQHLRRRRSSASSTTPLQSPPTLSASEKRRREAEACPPRRLYLTSDSPDFDPGILSRFRAEGFNVEYLPFPGGSHDDLDRDRKELENLLHEREDDLEPGERYAVVAYNKPAHLLLESHHQSSTATNPFPRLCALVAYYPDGPTPSKYISTSITSTTSPDASTTSSTTTPTTYPPSVPLLSIQVHLAGASSKTNPSTDAIHTRKRHRCHFFFYPESSARFAEPGSPSYDRLSARLAWSRALESLKRGFGWPGTRWRVAEVEAVWEEYWRCLSTPASTSSAGDDADPDTRARDEEDERSRRAAEIVGLMVGSGMGVQLESLALDNNYSGSGSGSGSGPGSGSGSGRSPGGINNSTGNATETYTVEENPMVNCVPTCAGANTPKSLTKFYTSQFLPLSPPTLTIRLLSRTTGPDRIVDELLLSFTHTHEIPWLLPHVPPTDRPVRIALVMTASFCAGKLARLNVYWDQASVLLQIGLRTVERLPVVGGEGVERVLS